MNRTKTSGLLLAACFAFAMLACMLIFTCKTYAYTGTRGTDVSKPAAGNEFVLFEGDFSCSPKAQIIAKINRIRKNACDKGETDPRNKSRKLTPGDYVPIKWSANLEWMAQTRAAEAALYDDHDRPNGRGGGISYNGLDAMGEILAWGSYESISSFALDSVSLWMFEHQMWLDGDYAWAGHYAALINPNYTYWAIGAFVPAGSRYGAACGLFTSESGLNEAQIGVSGRYMQVIEVASSKINVKSSQSVSVDKGVKTKVYLKATTKYHNVSSDEDDKDFYEEIAVYLTGAYDWKTKNKKIAVTDTAGNVTGKKQGKGTLTAKYGGKEYPVTVKVLDRKKSVPGRVKWKSLKVGKGKFTVKWKKISKKAKGYQVWITDGNDNYIGYDNFKKKTTSKTYVGVPAGTYKVKIRAFNKVNGEKVYGAWSKVKTVKMK